MRLPVYLFWLTLLATALVAAGCATGTRSSSWEPNPPLKSISLGETGSLPLAFRKVVYRIANNAVVGEVKIAGTAQEEMRWTITRGS